MAKIQWLLAGWLGLTGAVALSNLITPSIAIAQTVCGRTAPIASYETARHWVYICQEDGKLLYIQREKSTQNFFQLAARPTEFGFAADSSNTSFFISSNSLQVRQDGQLINYEPVLSRSKSNNLK
jgi:hypothetical protein